MTFRRAIALLFASTLPMASSAYAVDHVLANYGFNSTRTSSDSDLNSSASLFTNGPGIAVGSSTYGATGNPAPSLATDAGDTAATQPLSLTGNDYYEFTLTPNAGFQASLSSLMFDYAISGNVTGNFFVRSSVDSFAANVGSTATTSGSIFSTVTISLSASQFQNLTSAVTFRIYIYDNKSGNMSDLLDNVIVNGDLLAVPEPSTWAMMGLGAGLLGAIQRFRGRRA